MNNQTPPGVFAWTTKSNRPKSAALSRWRQIYYGITENGETYSLSLIRMTLTQAMESVPDSDVETLKQLTKQAAEVLPGRGK